MKHSVRVVACLVLLCMALLMALSGCQQQETPVATEVPATEAPTEVPATEAPTEAPATEEPTQEPTEQPTEAPTAAPASEAPTTEAPAVETTDAPEIAALSENGEDTDPTEAPAASIAPAVAQAPASTDGPSQTQAPEATEEPVDTDAPAPETTEAPEASEEPAPEGTQAPEETDTPAETAAPTATEAPAEQSAYADDAVVATVNGATITKGEVEETVRATIEQQALYMAMYGQAVDVSDESFQRMVAEAVVEMLAEQRIMEDKAKELGLWENTEEQEAALREQAQEQYDDTIEAYAPQYQQQLQTENDPDADDEEKVLELTRKDLEEQGFTYDWVLENLHQNEVTERLYNYAIADVTVTDEEAKASYEQMVETAKEQYAADLDLFVEDLANGAEPAYIPAGLRLIQHVMIQYTDEEDKGTAVETANNVLAEIQDGLSFEEAIAQYGEDSGMLSGPFVDGYPVWENTVLFAESFVQAAMALENVGDISGVVQDDYYVHILRYSGDLEEQEVPYEDRAEEYKATLLSDKQNAVYNDAQAQWIEAAEVTIDVDPLIIPEDLPELAVPETLYLAATHDETQVLDKPDGDARYTLSAGAPVAVLGQITLEDKTWGFAQVLGGEQQYGYVQLDALTAMEEQDALDAADANLVQVEADPEEAPLPLFTLVMNDGSLLYGELYPAVAPLTVGNFISLANQGFYDGIIFHRVIEGFVIQGGDPEGTGMGDPGYSIKGEFSLNGVDNDIIHERGVLSMARAQTYDSAGSQFFITLDEAPSLDGAYAGFGRVLIGMETADAIVDVPTDSSDRPKVDQVIKLVYVETYGVSYPMEKYQEPVATTGAETTSASEAETTQTPTTEVEATGATTTEASGT